MKHLKTWLIEKEWDKTQAETTAIDYDTASSLGTVPRHKKIAFGYTNLERAKKDVEDLNKECLQCPRRAALHTVYRVIPNAIYTRMLTSEETYESKSKIMSMSREQIGVK